MTPKWIRQDVLAGRVMPGAWTSIGSPAVADIASLVGFDWVNIDTEHGAYDGDIVARQIEVVGAHDVAAMVRVGAAEPLLFKRMLDLGASGVIVPLVESAEQAQQIVSATRYPPMGERGVARSVRAAGHGTEFERYFSEANDNRLVVTQIERPQAVARIDDIAAVDGVDVLFVGPLDLTTSLGVRGQVDQPIYRAAIGTVVAAAKNAGKAAGILLGDVSQIDQAIDDGFTFIACGTDKSMLHAGMRESCQAIVRHRR
jgi:2-keto-3-deoxy-L-rhamnonate aldolase RhmA